MEMAFVHEFATVSKRVDQPKFLEDSKEAATSLIGEFDNAAYRMPFEPVTSRET